MGNPEEISMGVFKIVTMQTSLVLAAVFLLSAPSVLAFAERPSTGPKVGIKFEAGPNPIGIFYVGNQTEAFQGLTQKPEYMSGGFSEHGDYEALAGVIPANGDLDQKMFLHHAFVVRSDDFKFRAKVAVFPNEEQSDKWPYVMYFKNLMTENPPKQMELKHSSSGYLWIPPTQHIAHRTGTHHTFEVRDQEKELIFKVTLNAVANEQDAL